MMAARLNCDIFCLFFEKICDCNHFNAMFCVNKILFFFNNMSGLICTKQQLLKTAINNLQTENSYIFYKSVKNRFSSKHDSKAVKKTFVKRNLLLLNIGGAF